MRSLFGAIAAFILAFTPTLAQTYHPNIAAINPASLISVNTPADVVAVRDSLRQQIFKSSSLPTLTPTFDFDYMDSVWAAVPNMGGVKRHTVWMSKGTRSIVWRFSPAVFRKPNDGRCGFIVHGGHSQNATKPPYRNMISKLVELGCEVWTIDMPQEGQNTFDGVINTGRGYFDVDRYGRAHNNLQITADATFNPLRFFMDAPLAVVNDMTNRGITNIGMTGLSGGGWTTDLYSALDDRVDISYSIAGSMPVYMRSWVPPMSTGSFGDWEQMQVPHLGVDYMDLYILAAVGPGSHHANIYIVNDDCCFGGYNGNHFASTVSGIAASLGGSYAVTYDTTVSTHTVSAWAVNFIAGQVTSRF
jgi:hypothetical protein